MFGSNNNPFGQSTSSPFGSQPAFGQTNNANNPFAPKPFGSPTPFGAQTGSSIFGGNSTGVFGQTSSPLTQTPSFGASSSPAFGSSTPAFGASSTPAFGSTSVFGQKPAFGGFGSSTTQTSPFGGAFQQSQPAFGNSLFGSSTQFGASSQPAFGGSSTPAFGTTSTPAFGSTSTPAFGSTPTPAFGSTGSAFGVSNASLFGSGGAFGTSSTPAFGTSSTQTFGAPSSPGFSFGSSPSFGQTTAAFGTTGFGTTPSAFGVQSSAYGGQSTTPTFGAPGFGQSAFGGGQRGGTRIAAYTPTAEVDNGSTTQTKLESISAMPVYKDKSHEELRWEDYQLGDKGGPAPAGQSTAATGFGASPTQSNNIFGGSNTFGQSSSGLFTSTAPTNPNPFAAKTPAFGSSFPTSSTPAFGSSPFGSTSNSNPFGANSSPSMFGGSAPAFSSPSLFNSNTSAFGSSPSLFNSAPSSGTAPAFSSGLSFGNTQSSGLFQSSTPALGQTNSVFGQTAPSFGQTAPSFGQGSSAFGQSSMFNTPPSGFGGNMFPSAPSLLSSSNSMGFAQSTPTLSTSFQSAQSAPATGSFGFGTFGQAQTAGAGGFGGTSSIFGQNTFVQLSAPQSAAVAQPLPVTNPFGTLPAMPQISIGRSGASPSIQYGISSLPVVDKPSPARVSSLLTSRHISQRRMRLPARKYNPKNDGPKVPFFNDDEETPSTPKADALFIHRENPRALVIRPLEHWPPRMNSDKSPLSTGSPIVVHTNGKIPEAVSNSLNGTRTEDKERDLTENGGIVKERPNNLKVNQKSNGVLLHDDHSSSSPKGDSYITLTGHRAGEAAIVYEHGADVEALMPKLRHSDYYTEPRIQELAAKERAEPGYCRRVTNFVVGRQGYGSIRFFGETDVRRLDLETLVQFNTKEVIVYSDESKKPPVGQGLNKPAEVTLLNIKCPNKKTGGFFTEGPRVDRYKEMLIRKAEDQGAEFVSFDPVKGEWKFRVQHFSVYMLGDEEEEEDYF